MARSKKQRVYNEGATSLYQNKVLWIQNWLSRNGGRSTVESCIENEEVNSSLLSKPPAYAVVSPVSCPSRSGSSSKISRQSSMKKSKVKMIKVEEDETEV